MPVPTPRRSRHTAAALAVGALTAGLLVAVPGTASAATPLPIAAIQGTGQLSPYVGQSVTTTPSVVTAAYPTGGLKGFVIQTPGTGGKKRSLKKASDALFVYTNDAPVGVKVGDLVTVSGTVEEYRSGSGSDADTLTEIAGAVTVAKSEASYQKVRPVSGVTWASTYDRRENLESMLFSNTEKWTVNDTYDLGTYGELGLATGGRLVQPTDKATYGSKAALKQETRNEERRVVLSDGSSTIFDKVGAPGTPPFITRKTDVKVGDSAKLTEPVVVDWRNGAWTFTPTRPTAAGDEVATIKDRDPEKVPNVKGDVSVASFNVLNYFTTLGSSSPGCEPNPVSTDGTPNTVRTGCDARGAWDAADLDRQQTKIVKAINGLDASVTGLMEIENSARLGEEKDEATKTLVAALNRAAGRAKWDYVPSSDQLQPVEDQDVITNALIFQPDEVVWAGKSYADGKDSTDTGPFGNARTPIAAAFTPVGGGAPMLVAVNHFKSKSSGGATGANVDSGQGAYNADRVAQANALLGWLPGVQSDARTDAVALVGDFNAYTHEDPLENLYDAGFANAAKQKDYSYNFEGLSGSLDHVLLNPAAKKRLTGSGVWNINSPEPVLREYSRYKSTAIDYYRTDVYRASDHDPVVVGLKKGKARETTLTLLNINDFHGRIEPPTRNTTGTVQFFGTIEQQRAAAGDDNTLLLSAGDNIGASLFASSVQEDQPTIDVLNAADLAASAVGNHEFDRGFADLEGRVQKAADWPYLGANVYRKGTKKAAMPSYVIVERAGLKVGIVGAVTQETPTLVSPAGVAGLDFGDPVEAVNKVTKKLTDGKKSNGEADVVVAEYHEGGPKTQLDPAGAEVATLADQVAASPVFAHIVNDTSAKVAAIFTGHTHQLYAYDAPVPGKAGATRPVTQTRSYGAYVSKVSLTVDTKTKAVLAHTQTNVPTTKTADADLVAAYPRVRRISGIVDAALDRSDELGSVKIGEATHEITRAYGTDGEDSRALESTLGNLVAEMYRSSTASPERGSAQIGVQNPGGVRDDLDEGTVTFGQAAAILPFANSLFTVDLTGAQFKTLLEQQWQTALPGQPTPSRAYLQLGLSKNVTYTYDEDLAPGGRITSIAVDGKAIDPAATYRVATNSFLAAGGDNFRVFAEGKNSKDTGLSDLDSWTDYLKAETPVSPSFAKQAVAVSPLPSTLTAGQSTTVTLASLDFSSRPTEGDAYQGSDEHASTVTAKLGATEVGTAPAADGTATVTVTVPAGAAKGATILVITTDTGTTVTIPVTVG